MHLNNIPRNTSTSESILHGVAGRARLSQHLVVPDRNTSPTWFEGTWTDNQVCYDWGVSAAALMRRLQDGKQYYIGGMYIEFANSLTDISPVPTISRDTTSAYYLGLSSTKDFLRVPLIATSGSNSDSDNFSGDNVATFYAQTAGTTGFRNSSPLTFSDSANSRVYGAALVAFLDESDITQDLIISRIYWAPGQQVAKAASSQIGVTWALTFG